MINQNLVNIYDELDAELHSLSVKLECKGCGNCCDFRIYEHIPHFTNLELTFIKSELLKDAGLLQKASEKQDLKLCPFYRNKKCIGHRLRPLSCRVFFCDKQFDNEFASQIYEKYHQKIKDLHTKFELEYSYLRLVESLASQI